MVFSLATKKTVIGVIMEKKQNAFWNRLVNAFKSRVVRNLVIFGFLLLSVFCMMLLDEGNYIRGQYLPGLSDNFISKLLDAANINRYNIGLETWFLFFAIISIIAVFLVANMFADKYVAKKVETNKEKFETEKKAKRFYTTQYYLITLAVAVVLLAVFIIAGGFKSFRDTSTTLSIFIDLLYTLLLCLFFIVCCAVVLVLATLLLRAICFFFVLLTTGLSREPQKGESDGAQGEGGSGGSGGSFDGGSFTTKIEENDTLNKDLFPALTAMDLAYADGIPVTESDEITLEEFTLRFQSYCCNQCKVYYELPVLRAFVAGLATSRLLILQGLSGTGKSLMPRMFSQFTGSNVFFAPVQSTWRDKTDVLGFYSEFTKTFKITDFLSDLYSASYTDKTTMMILDEMNLSRIEYYFADFLSILEYPKEEWKIKVYDPELGQRLPNHLTDGYVTIPANTWFIGTANTDDSTFIITDKVYDRAITLVFRERVNKISSNYISDPINISSEKLQELFDEAKANEKYCLSALDTERFLNICDFIRDAFDIRFGNRIMVQITQFVPVYVALGGTKEAALDFMLASKVLRKLEGVFEDYVKDELIKLTKLLNSTYGKGVMVETERIIAKILKRLV